MNPEEINAASGEREIQLPTVFEECLATFSLWPLECPSSKEMAACGLLRTDDNCALCFFSKKPVGPCCKGDNPWIMHYNACQCPFILENPMHPQMKHYKKRRISFKDWPTLERDYPTPKQLASHGYFFSSSYTVACFFCGTYFRGYDGNEDLWAYHGFSQCPFMLKSNRPLKRYNLRPLSNRPLRRYDLRPLSRGGVRKRKCIGPKHPDMCDYGDRLETLSEPECQSAISNALAECGFFHTQQGITCFFCGVRLKNYHQLDDVCVEHSEKSESRCPFARKNERPPGYFDIVKHPVMADVDVRIQTLNSWDYYMEDIKDYPAAEEVAKCGFFFYDFIEVRIACFFCGKYINCHDEYWSGKYNLWERHVDMGKGRCPFVLQKICHLRPKTCDGGESVESIAPKHPDMSHEDDRLRTLSNNEWRSPIANLLAQCGFSYNESGHITCFFCGVRLPYCKKCDQMDDVCVEHVKKSERRCPLALKNERPPRYFEIVKHPLMMDFDVRIQTLECWDDYMIDYLFYPEAEEVARCGFFRLDSPEFGIACFFCGKVINCYEEKWPTNFLWERHVELARGRCPFVLQNKNPLFN